jgi:hypothetical protein
MIGDEIVLTSETADGEPLLELVMEGGQILQPLPTLEDARVRLSSQLRQIPEGLLTLDAEPSYRVSVSQQVQDLARETDALIERQIAGDGGMA